MATRTFQEWLDGKYGLYSSDILFLNRDGKNVIIPADMPEVEKRKIREKRFAWTQSNEIHLIYDNELPPEVLASINVEQERIFNNRVQEITTRLIEGFQSNSNDPKYLEDEIHDIKVILGFRNSDQVLQKDIESNFFYNRSETDLIDLIQIREYYLKVIKPNRPKHVGFISSPNFQFQDRNNIPCQIMATAFFEYLKWLEVFDFKALYKADTYKKNKHYNAPQIAIALYALDQSVTWEVAKEWLAIYSTNKSIKGLMDENITNIDSYLIKQPDLRAYNTKLKNLNKANEILKLSGRKPGMKKIEGFIKKLNDNNPAFIKY